MGRKMVFIISCPRSGSSILGEVLRRHPDIAYLGETGQRLWNLDDYQALSPDLRDHHERGPELLNPYVRSFVYDTLEGRIHDAIQRGDGRPENNVILDKCPPNTLRIRFLHRLFPDAKFIHLIRDGRDVVCSLRPGLETNWMFVRPKDWEMMARQPEAIRRGALLWRCLVNRAAQDLDRIANGNKSSNVRQIFYEKLVKSPSLTTLDLMKFIGLTATDDQLTWASYSLSDCAESGHQPDIGRHWIRKDHRNRIGRHKENLAPSEAAQVHAMLNIELRKYGYI